MTTALTMTTHLHCKLSRASLKISHYLINFPPFTTAPIVSVLLAAIAVTPATFKINTYQNIFRLSCKIVWYYFSLYYYYRWWWRRQHSTVVLPFDGTTLQTMKKLWKVTTDGASSSWLPVVCHHLAWGCEFCWWEMKRRMTNVNNQLSNLKLINISRRLNVAVNVVDKNSGDGSDVWAQVRWKLNH